MKKIVMKIVKGIEMLSACCFGMSSALLITIGFETDLVVMFVLSLIILCTTFKKIEEEMEE